jgi:hypothetical protein
VATVSPSKYPPREQLVLLNEELSGRAALQSDEIEGIDRKASTMLAGTGVVLGLVVNNVGQFQGEIPEARYLFFGSLAVLAVGLVAGVFALWPRRVRVVPEPRGLVEGYYAQDHDHTLANLVSIRLRALEENKNFSRHKVLSLRAQMLLLAAGGIGLVLAFIAKEWS